LEEQRERLQKELESKQEELNGLKVQLDEKIGAKEIEMKDLQSEMEENRQKMFELQKLIDALEEEKKTLEAALGPML
jgi:chromosome segregation ATPase